MNKPLQYRVERNSPQIVYAIMGKDIVGEIILLLEPIKYGQEKYYYIIHFYPTKEILYAQYQEHALGIMEEFWQFHRVSQASL